MDGQRFQKSRGHPEPLGATPDAEGVNFSLYSEHATSVELLLFAAESDAEPSVTLPFVPHQNKTFYFWHRYVKGVGPGQIYAYRVGGPSGNSANGYRFDPDKVLIDPYARGNLNNLWKRMSASGPGDNVATSMRSVVIDAHSYDWEDDEPLDIPLEDTIIYEMHVGGFTRSPTSGCAHPGTFRGVIERIPYLQDLGVTAVELLPIFDFDETETGTYWGYDTYAHFAPQSSYCVEPNLGKHLDEFRDMVKALHRAGIEVILDVVFNHTDEGNEEGPTISFRGLANEAYYHLKPHDRLSYENYSGCGNAVNANHPLVSKFIMECLEYWVREHHVDGFRFDLGSVLCRGTDGQPMEFPPVIWNIELSPVLRHTKIIAEPWGAGYHVGRFPGKRWREWNDQYRDAVRRFVRGVPGVVGAVADGIGGSAPLYQGQGEGPTNSINYVTCHDGLPLNDLVTYNTAQGWNCGVEGPTDDPGVESLRERQIKNFAILLLLSRGVPMILGGDEFRRTQQGNDNAYRQDNKISWFDWDLVNKRADMVRFWRESISFRKRFSALRRREFFDESANNRGVPDVSWHGCRLHQPGWNDPNATALAFTLAGEGDEPDLHVVLNMYHLGLDFELPQLPDRRWFRAIDTAKPSPDDITDPGGEVLVDGTTFHAWGHSVVVLISKE